MSAIIIKRNYRRKPKRFLLPNLSNPLARGLQLAVPFLEGAGDAKSYGRYLGITFAPQNNAEWSQDTVGRTGYVSIADDDSWRSIGTSLQLIVGSVGSNIGDHSILSVFKFDTPPTDDRGCIYAGEVNGSRSVWMGYRDASNNFGAAVGSWSADLIATSALPAVGVWNACLYTYKNSDQAINVYPSWTSSFNGTSSTVDISARGRINIGQIFDGGGYGEGFDGHIALTLVWDRVLTDAEALALVDNPWQIFPPRRIWVPAEAGPPGPVQLNIDGLSHEHPLDQCDLISSVTELNIDDLSHVHDLKEVDLGGNYILSVDSPTHAHPLDQCAVAEVGANFPLDIDKLTHQHPVDQANLTPTYFLGIDKLTHQHLIDEPEFTIPPNDLVIDNLTHAHPVDESDLGGIYGLNIQGLSHDHPVDQSNLGGLEGDDTALKMTPTQWLARAGVELANTSGVDTTNWHVVEIVFNGVTSVLTIDGVKVEGDAGIRSLEAVILGAGLARDERANIQVGELQLYSGNVPEVDRVTIRNDLTTKWITG